MRDLGKSGGAPGNGTRQQQIVDILRDLAVNGHLDPGQKYSEAALAERLHVSRTPIRHALAVLVEEGVIQRAGGRGYVVRRYDASDIATALELRAVLEGLAARKAATTGLSTEIAARLDACLADGDDLFRSSGNAPVDEARYAEMNAAFHGAIVANAATPMLEEVRAVLDRVPYGAPVSIRFDRVAPADRALHLRHAHLQHHYIVAAIRAGDGARAEAIFREHGELIKVSLGLSEAPWPRQEGGGLPIGSLARGGDGSN